jgi:hypothetical protein
MTLTATAPRGHGSAQGRWISSSKSNPCPVCGRDADSKCRRRDDQIHCYRGSRFGPPENLSRGGVLHVDGADWYLAEPSGGFSGNHAVFRRHQPTMPGRKQPPAQPQQIQRQVELLRTSFNRSKEAVDLCIGLPALDTCTIQELRDNRDLLACTLRRLHWLAGHLRHHRRLDPSIPHLATVAGHWVRQLEYQFADLQAFMRRHLGEQQVSS